MGGRIGLTELLVILGLAVLLFGNRLPGIGKSLGEGLKNFKKGLNTDSDEEKEQHSQTQQNPTVASLTAGQNTQVKQEEKSTISK